MPSLPTQSVDEKLTFNRKLKRCIDCCHDGRYSLFTYNRVSDEEYRVVRTRVSRAQAFAWLQGEEIPAFKQQATARRLAARVRAALEDYDDGRMDDEEFERYIRRVAL